ncbi:MAG: flagellar biosynthesis protein FliQ [Alphaproteobacteria bacterium]
MVEQDILEVMQDAIWTMIQVAGPIMLIALVVGVAVSLVQALTQIQEMTLAFVPKILVVFLSLLLMLPFMLATMDGFMQRITDRIATLS